MRIILFLLFLLPLSSCLQAQTTPRNAFQPHRSKTPLKIAYTKVIIVKSLPQSIILTAPKTALSRIKPLRKTYKRFVPRSFWKKTNTLGLTLNEVAFVNWNAGGDNAISAQAEGHFGRNYKFRHLNWNNDLHLRYGLNAQEGRKLRKTDDQIRFSSTLSFRRDTLTHWYYSFKINCNTQFSDGFTYPDRSNPISRFMAPGYLFLGMGLSYLPPGEAFTLYLSPGTLKATFVLDETLSRQGAFGVTDGKKIFAEYGFLITNTWNTELLKNVLLDHKLTLYTDYFLNFGNVDVDWQLNFNLKVNEWIHAHLGTHLIYDDDIKFGEIVAADGTVLDPGTPKIQFKQLLGVGLRYTF